MHGPSPAPFRLPLSGSRCWRGSQIKEKLLAVAHEWDRYPMLARTHGQPASPTTMGKEIMVFADRIDYQTK